MNPKPFEILFSNFEKIDAHLHLNTLRPTLNEIALEQGFRLLTINTEVPFFPDISTQAQFVSKVNKKTSTQLYFITTFSTEHWGETGWQDEAIKEIENHLNNGAVGVKIWKNIGMGLKNKNGDYIMADDPSFEPIYRFLSKNQIPLLAHLGEPKNCWLPIDEMTVTSDKDYFSKHPEYHMYKKPEMPSYKDQLKARDNVLDKFPDIRFIGAHLASLEWSVKELSVWLDKYPNVGVDLAERVCHLQYQAGKNYKLVKEFVETYQDRIIYGSDQIDDGSLTVKDLHNELSEKWISEFKFFALDTVQKTSNVPFLFKGLDLSEEVLQKIFRNNALNYYPTLNKKISTY